MHKKLFIPGPVDVKEEVLQRMSAPMIGHRTKEASALQRSISGKMQKLMYTKNAILLSTSSGTGLMEGAVRSCTAKRAAVFSVGALVTGGINWQHRITCPPTCSSLNPAATPEMVDKACPRNRPGNHHA